MRAKGAPITAGSSQKPIGSGTRTPARWAAAIKAYSCQRGRLDAMVAGESLRSTKAAGLAADAAADTPVLLDGPAAHRLYPVEGEVARGERVGDPSAEPRRLLVVHARVLRQDVAAGRGLRLAAGRQEGARPA
jgi:hypothetical protein